MVPPERAGHVSPGKTEVFAEAEDIASGVKGSEETVVVVFLQFTLALTS